MDTIIHRYIIIQILILIVSLFTIVQPLYGQNRQIILDDSLHPMSDFDLYVTDSLFIAVGQLEFCYLFDKKTGEFLAEIDPSVDFPGFNWFPIKMEVLNSGLFFTNSGPWGFFISRNNDNVKVLGREFLAPTNFKFISDTVFAGIYTRIDGDVTISLLDSEGIKIREFEKTDFFARYAMYRLDNLFLHLYNNQLLFINPFDANLYTYSMDGDLLEIIPLNIPQFKRIPQDINPSVSPHQSIQDLSKMISRNSFISRSFMMNDGILLLGVIDENRARMVYYDVANQRILTTSDSGFPDNKLPAYASGSNVYLLDFENDRYVVSEYHMKFPAE
ncbi:MAG: hypothetical protein LC662_06240 [Rhodothermaceae bacterium]|nr:hypothetical protein [Rhodothermaceae bacterium]